VKAALAREASRDELLAALARAEAAIPAIPAVPATVAK